MPDDDTTSTPTTASSPADGPAADGSPDQPAPAAPARRRTRSAAGTRRADATAAAEGPPGESGNASAAPRKRAPRKSTARRPAALEDAAAAQPAAVVGDGPVAEDSPSVVEVADEAESQVGVLTPEPAASASDDAESAVTEPAVTDPAVTEPAAPERPAAARTAPSGFALLARAAPVFSHPPSARPTAEVPVVPAAAQPFAAPAVPPAPPAAADAVAEEPDSDDPAAADLQPAADPSGVTPESLLAALDATAAPVRGRRGRRPAAGAAAVEAAPIFVPPVPVFVDPADYWGPGPGAGAEPDDEDTAPAADGAGETSDDTTDGAEDADESGTAPGRRRRRRGGRRRRGSGEQPTDSEPAVLRPVDPAADGDDEAMSGGRAPSFGDSSPDGLPADAGDEATTSVAPADDGGQTDEDGADAGEGRGEGGGEGDEDATGSRRRRRRRRRGGDEAETTTVDDPPDTVVRVREPRRPRAKRDESESEITPARGSTRIEAKRQRRRDGRDARKRPPILTEAEFLARRESVARSMLVRDRDGRTQIAVLEDGILVEHYIAEDAAPADRSMIGDVYLGRVQNVLPAMEAAFIDIGRGRNAVLYAGEVDWDGLGMEGKPKRIELALKSGQSVLVQVTKDPIGQKGSRLTAQISLAGRYLVLVPNGSMSGISRKLPDAERARLKKILKDLLPAKAGVIVRTAAEGASEEELAADVARLTGQWDAISAQAATASAPALLQGEPNLATKVVRDIFNEDFGSLVVSGEKVLEQVRSYVGSVAPNLLDRVRPWTSEQDLFTANRVDEQLVKALDRKVFLPSGGSLVIDRTEAMTVVDVNTGRFTGSGGNLEETVTENNLEAAEELVRQLRLRDIGGIIVVDFIDMVFEANRDLVIRRLVECLGRDRTRHQVAEVSSLGLVQMTRKRIGRGLLEVFGHTCEVCRGRGMVVDLDGHGISEHDPSDPAPGGPLRIPNPGNTGRAHLRTIATLVPAGGLSAGEAAVVADLAGDPDDVDLVVGSGDLEPLAEPADEDGDPVVRQDDPADPVPTVFSGGDDSDGDDSDGDDGVAGEPRPADPDDGVDRDLSLVVSASLATGATQPA